MLAGHACSRMGRVILHRIVWAHCGLKVQGSMCCTLTWLLNALSGLLGPGGRQHLLCMQQARAN